MRWTARIGVVVAVAVVAAACGGGSSSDDRPVVEVFGPYVGVEADAFAASMAAFEVATGIDVLYTGSIDFTSDLRQRAASGVDAPDIALVPQPALIVELHDDGHLVALDEATQAALATNYDVDPDELGAGGAADYVVPYRTSVKSLVWYRPEVFEQNDWTIPETLSDLSALVDDVRADTDIAPWCFTVYSGTSTGWPATDWVEDLLLRRGGEDAYDNWTTGTTSFTDPLVRDAFVQFHELAIESGASSGGLRTVLQVEVDQAWEPLLADPAGCAMYKQASFASAWFPSGIDFGPDGELDFFVFPGVAASTPAPLVVAGDAAVQFNDQDATHALMAYLATPESGREWAQRGGYTSARVTADANDYASEIDRRVAALLVEDRVHRFDGSDVLPPAIGSDLLWSEMTDWIAGTRPLDAMLDALDEAMDAQPQP